MSKRRASEAVMCVVVVLGAAVTVGSAGTPVFAAALGIVWGFVMLSVSHPRRRARGTR